MRLYESVRLLKGEDMNNHHTLLATRTAAWVVEVAAIAAGCEHGDPEEVVFLNLHDLSITRALRLGDVVNITSRVVRVGTTSITTVVEMLSEVSGQVAAQAFVTMVSIDNATGKKKPHSIKLDEPQDEKEAEQRRRANALFAQ